MTKIHPVKNSSAHVSYPYACIIDGEKVDIVKTVKTTDYGHWYIVRGTHSGKFLAHERDLRKI